MKTYNSATTAIALAMLMVLSGCSGEADEAKKLGFSSVEEMKEIHAKGWHTKERYEADSAKSAGFTSVAEWKISEKKKLQKIEDDQTMVQLRQIVGDYSESVLVLSEKLKSALSDFKKGQVEKKDLAAIVEKIGEAWGNGKSKLSALKSSNPDLQNGIDSLINSINNTQEQEKLIAKGFTADLSVDEKNKLKEFTKNAGETEKQAGIIFSKYGFNMAASYEEIRRRTAVSSGAYSWEEGVKYKFYGVGEKCTTENNSLCMTEDQFKAACLAAKGVTRYAMKVRGTVATREETLLAENGRYEGHRITFGMNRRGENVCSVSVTMSGIIDGSSRRLDIWGNAKEFIKGDSGSLLVSYFTQM